MNGCIEGKVKEYLENLAAYCNRYDAFAIPAARIAASSKKIRLEDVYTSLPIAKVRTEDKSSWRNDLEVEVSPASLHLTMIMADPGGGKTTLLKWYTRLLANVLLKEENVELPDVLQSLLCKQKKTILSEPENKKIPIFIKIRDVEHLEAVNFDEKLSCDAIKYIVKYTMQSFSADLDVEELLDEHNEFVLLIDGIEEFSTYGRISNFYHGLKEFFTVYDKSCFVVSTRIREFRDFLSSKADLSETKGYYFDEYAIKKLNNIDNSYVSLYDKSTWDVTADFAVIKEFADKWFEVLTDVEKPSRQNSETFIASIKENEKVISLLNGPLELTSFLMLSTYDNCLPSDLNQILEKSVELWLGWANGGRFHLGDVKIQIAQIAYQMTERGRIKSTKEELVEIIRRTRQDFAGYFLTEQMTDDKSIEDFLFYLIRSGLLKFEYGAYEFLHRQYQSYFTAFCIKENYFPRAERKRNRFEYLCGHLREKNSAWEEVIILAAMQDHIMQEDIIEEYYNLSEQYEDENYFPDMLMELVSVPGIYFKEEEKEKICRMLLVNEKRFELLESVKFTKMVRTNTEQINDVLIKFIIDKTESGMINGNSLEYPLFYIILICKCSMESVKNVLDTLCKVFGFECEYAFWRLSISLSEHKYNFQVVRYIWERAEEELNIGGELRKMVAHAEMCVDMCLGQLEEQWEEGHPYEFLAKLYEMEDYNSQFVATYLFQECMKEGGLDEVPPLQEDGLEEVLISHYNAFMENGRQEDVQALKKLNANEIWARYYGYEREVERYVEWLAWIEIYACGKNSYERALELYESGKYERQLVATKMVWFVSDKKVQYWRLKPEHTADVTKETILRLCSFISSGLTDSEHEDFISDYRYALMGLCRSGFADISMFKDIPWEMREEIEKEIQSKGKLQ